ncbi:MAG: hypothetical protein WBM02_01020 [bacterium]
MKKLFGTALALLVAATGITWSQGFETFDNFPATGTSYQTGTFLGQDGSTWTYIQCRGDYEITGKALMIGRNRNPQSNVYSGTISGGIGELNFDYMQSFSNNVNLNVLVNDIVVGNVTSTSEMEVVKNSGPITINVAGDFVIKFINVNNSDGQVTIDNIEWTGYGATPTPVPVSIYDIQYTTDPSGDSPYKDIYVITTGIVTAAKAGFNTIFIQDGAGPWNGIQVYGVSGSDYVEGDEVEITGKVTEYFGMTEINPVTDIDLLSQGNPLPAFAVITTNEVNQEQYEGVLCRVENVTVTDPNLGFNEWEVDDGSGPVVVNDLFYRHTPQLNEVYDYVQGPVDFFYDTYKIEPRYAEDIDAAPPTPVPTMPCEEELLWNKDFEEWSAGPNAPPDYWALSSLTVNLSFEQTTDYVHSGDYAVKVTKNQTGTGHFEQLVPYQVNEGSEYTFSFYVIDNDGVSGNRCRGWINWYSDPAGLNYINQTIQSIYTSENPDWQKYTITGTAIENAVAARVRIAFYGATGVDYYIDSASFQEICEFEPTATPEPTETPTETPEPTDTPSETPEPPPIPATGPTGIGLLLIGLGALIGFSRIRRS